MTTFASRPEAAALPPALMSHKGWPRLDDDDAIGIPPAGQNEPILERYAVVDLIHVTRLEPLDNPLSPTNN